MRISVSWSIAASVELQAIIDFIDLSDSDAADRLGRRLATAARSLDTFPHRGREIEPGIRQLSVVYPYLIRYRVIGGRVEILSVRHGARDEDAAPPR